LFQFCTHVILRSTVHYWTWRKLWFLPILMWWCIEFEFLNCYVFGDVGDLTTHTYMLMHSINVFSIILSTKTFGGIHKIVLFNDRYIHLCLLEWKQAYSCIGRKYLTLSSNHWPIITFIEALLIVLMFKTTCLKMMKTWAQ